MVDYRLVVTQSAENDMHGIMPKKHPLIEDVFLYSLDYRMLPVKNYIIFYSVDDTPGMQSVNIERILYAGRDWQSILKI
jgi:plasmid stabilization system protein ParE